MRRRLTGPIEQPNFQTCICVFWVSPEYRSCFSRFNHCVSSRLDSLPVPLGLGTGTKLPETQNALINLPPASASSSHASTLQTHMPITMSTERRRVNSWRTAGAARLDYGATTMRLL